MNPGVKSRYFSRVKFDPLTSMDFFPLTKSPGTYRIFCLGASTTAGYPYGYVGSFSTFLTSRLQALLPDRQVEMINLGLTATNSFTTLDFADELFDYEPDLIIVYDGHNEFYGALGAASNESVGTWPWLTRFYLTMVHSRVFVALRDAYNGLGSLIRTTDEVVSAGTMMERLSRGQYVPYGSDLYASSLETFRDNMRSLASLCLDHGIPLILSSQVSNLRHQRPFVPANSAHLPPGRRSELERLLNTAGTLLGRGDPRAARSHLSDALSLDSLRADVHYELARCLDTLQDKRMALRAYQRARDLDQLRFRTSTEFNDAIRDVAGESGVFFADLEAVFCAASPDSIVGRELILEHLHPNARGYFLMAKEYARLMRKHSLLASEADWAASDTVSDEFLWSRRSVTEIDDRAASRRTEVLVSSWPFRQFDKPITPPASDDRIGVLVDEMLSGKISWEQAHVSASEHYEHRGEFGLAENEYETLITMIPQNVSPYLRLGRLFLKQLKYEEGYRVLKRSLDIEPSVYACRALGAIAVDTGHPAQAVPFLEKAVELSTDPEEKVESNFLLALALGRAGMIDRAKEQLEQVLALNPAHKQARDLLNRLGQGR
jgi:tetratricopeptide (TPR) repeat protein